MLHNTLIQWWNTDILLLLQEVKLKAHKTTQKQDFLVFFACLLLISKAEGGCILLENWIKECLFIFKVILHNWINICHWIRINRLSERRKMTGYDIQDFYIEEIMPLLVQQWVSMNSGKTGAKCDVSGRPLETELHPLKKLS